MTKVENSGFEEAICTMFCEAVFIDDCIVVVVGLLDEVDEHAAARVPAMATAAMAAGRVRNFMVWSPWIEDGEVSERPSC